MPPATIALIMSLVEELIKIEPALAADLSALFSTGNPTPADWLALRAKVLGQDFATLAPNAAANLPAPVTPAPALDAATPPPVTPPPPVDNTTPPAPPVVDSGSDTTETASAPAPALATHPIFGTPITPAS